MKRTLIGLLLALPLTAVTAAAQAPPAAPATIAQRTSGLERHDGFLPMYLDTNRGRVLLEVSKFGEDVLYYVSYATSPGSVEIGMDRGIARPLVIRFERTVDMSLICYAKCYACRRIRSRSASFSRT